VRLGGLGSHSGLEPRRNLVTVCAPLASVGSPVAVGGLLGVLQAFRELSQVDALQGGEGGPGLGDSLAPGTPLFTGALGGGERREGRSIFRGDGLAGDLLVVVLLPLSSVSLPSLGCKEKSNCQNR